MSNLRDDILNLIATANPSAADCIAVPVSIGALYAARMDIGEEVFIGMCRRALVSARRVWRNHDQETIGEKIYTAKVIDQIMHAQGVRNYVPPRSFSNLQLGRNQVVNFVQGLQFGTVRR